MTVLLKVKEKIKSIVKANKLLYILYYDVYINIRRYLVRKKIHKSGFNLLEDIHEILDKGNLCYFVDFGTLLGFIREKGFIKHDLDIDIGIIKYKCNNHITDKVSRLLTTDTEIRLKNEYIYKGVVVEQSYLYKGIKFDICYYEENEGFSKCYLFYKDLEEKLNYPDDTAISVVKMTYDKIKGIKRYRVGKYSFNIPLDAEKLLEQKYGGEWKTPNNKWVYWKAPSASKCEDFGIKKSYL